MGFTPFPYAISTAAIDYVYEKIATDADIISHHFDNGVPWVEALSGDDFHPNLISDWQYKLAKTPAGHKIFLSVTPISIDRDSLAPYRGEEGGMPLLPPWDTISFNHPDVKEAFLNYCTRVKEFFNPDYFAIGIEVNLLKKLNPDLWNNYLELHKHVYQQLKIIDSSTPIFVTFTGMDLVEGYTDANYMEMRAAVNDIVDHTDYFGVSVYPFLSSFATDSIPADMFKKIFYISSKPICITETGYPAEYMTVYNGTIVLEGTPEKQDEYIKLLLETASEYGLEFVINFVLRDYDLLWQEIGSPDDLNKLWRDTGLYDEDGNTRISHQTWMNWLNK